MENIRAALFDEVNVCVQSAIYSSWNLSHRAPSYTYGGNLFKFLSRESKAGGKWPWDLGLEVKGGAGLGLGWGLCPQGGLGFCTV